MEDRVKQLRSEIDQLDRQLIEILSERGEIVRAIGREKEVSGLPSHCPVREKQILGWLEQNNPGPYRTEDIQDIFQKIFRMSLLLQ